MSLEWYAFGLDSGKEVNRSSLSITFWQIAFNSPRTVFFHSPLPGQQRQLRLLRGHRLALRTALPGDRRIQTLLRGGAHRLGGAEYEYPLQPRWRLRAGTDLSRQEHRRQEYNRMTLSLHTGPRWIIARNAEVSLLASRRHPLRLQPATVSDPGRTRIQRPVLRLRTPPR